ncbi:AIM18 [Candida theae]|uniref:Altered inheritance of mitochondria protein 18, mitochondrial n=1 Tax=Candida theae TaxID=1198502 RepID=A0AAD5BHF7_9ASCO|nr:AIM18 [Candida theae]KAI5963414.1 AIM18 [Candida theae]
MFRFLLKAKPVRYIPALAVSAYAIHHYQLHYVHPQQDHIINLDTQQQQIREKAHEGNDPIRKPYRTFADEIDVDDSISAFPTVIPSAEYSHEPFELVGHGVRTVTFLGFKVYGIGIYINQHDIPQALEILKEFSINNPALPDDEGVIHVAKAIIDNPSESDQVAYDLLDNGVRFLARVCPVRNTDFNHMKDGLIKSILSGHKNVDTKQQLNQGLEELKSVFSGFRGSVPQNDLLVLEVLRTGELALSYVNQKSGEVKKMGVVGNPLIGKTLMWKYLSSTKPLSESLRKSCTTGFGAILDHYGSGRS